MAITDWFRRRTTTPPPDDLLAALMDGMERQDWTGLMQLINENSERIKREFPSWTTAPEHVRHDPAALERYANTLIMLATLFAKSGDSSLRDLLEGRGRNNPIKEWTSAVERADQLIKEGKAVAAIPLLRTTLEQIRGASGTGVDHFYPRVLGRLGAALDQVGEKDEAIRLMQEALNRCKQAGDDEGVEVYTRNLQAFGAPGLVLPLTDRRFHVVFFDADGRVLSPGELANARGKLRYEVRGGDADPEAKRIHEEGRSTGARGDHDGAIALFTRAATVDPGWPYPIYDRAFAHLMKQEFDAALADYRKVLELSPEGFFVAAQAADLLSREAAGEFPPGLYGAFAMLEHVPEEQQRMIAAQLVEKFPSHAAAWDLHANFINEPTAKLIAIERGLGARPDRDTRGSLLARKALTLDSIGQTDSALELLQALIDARDSLSTQAKAVVFAALIRSKQASTERRPDAGGG